MKPSTKYSPEVRDRAVRLALEHQGEQDPRWSATPSVASKLGCTAETLRKWARQAERDWKPAGRAFSRLRAQEAESGFAEKSPAAPTFFRAGIAGSWRTVLTPVQVRAVVDAHGEVMERFGYPKEARAFLRGSREPKPR